LATKPVRSLESLSKGARTWTLIRTTAGLAAVARSWIDVLNSDRAVEGFGMRAVWLLGC